MIKDHKRIKPLVYPRERLFPQRGDQQLSISRSVEWFCSGGVVDRTHLFLIQICTTLEDAPTILGELVK
jgi:hypothetical protein